MSVKNLCNSAGIYRLKDPYVCVYVIMYHVCVCLKTNCIIFFTTWLVIVRGVYVVTDCSNNAGTLRDGWCWAVCPNSATRTWWIRTIWRSVSAQHFCAFRRTATPCSTTRTSSSSSATSWSTRKTFSSRRISSPTIRRTTSDASSKKKRGVFHLVFICWWRGTVGNMLVSVSVLHRGGLGRLAAWHLPGGPVGPASRWATTSHVEVDQTTYPVNRGRVGRTGREGSEGQSHKEEEREGRSGTGEAGSEPLALEGGLYLDICASPEFLVTPLLMRPVDLLSQGPFKNQSAPDKASATSQPTRRTQPFIRLGSVNEYQP